LKLEVQEVAHDTGADLSSISPINILPLLETANGTIAFSSSIVRYLGSISQNQLYGGENAHNQALVDQWLDIINCDFEPAVAAISVVKDGR
jgi:glutathione S-transferase